MAPGQPARRCTGGLGRAAAATARRRRSAPCLTPPTVALPILGSAGQGKADPNASTAAGSHGRTSRAGSLATKASADLALLSLASTASADLGFRRAESLLPCGLTRDELVELTGRRVDDGRQHSYSMAASVGTRLGGGVTIGAGGLPGGGAVGDKQ
jgi:hypothetical protein